MIYGILIVALLLAAISFDLFPWSNISRSHNVFYRLFLITFIFIAAFRWKVGGDTFNYQDVFENELPLISNIADFYSISTKVWEPLFIGLMSLCKTILDRFWFFQLVHAIILNVIIFSFIKRECKAKFIGITIYFLFQYLYFNMEILRESLAICVFLLSYPSYRDRRWKTYYLGVIIACLFHISAVITLFAPFFRNMKMNRGGIFLLVAFFIITQIAHPFLGEILPILFSNDFVTQKLLTYSFMRFNMIGVLYNLMLFCVIPAIAIYSFKSQLIKKFEGVVYFYFVIAIFFLALNGFGRFINYLSPFVIVYASSCVYLMLKKKKHLLLRSMMIFLVVALPVYTKLSYYSEDTSKLVEGTRRYNIWIPYHTIFTKEEYNNRRELYEEFMEEGLERALDQAN